MNKKISLILIILGIVFTIVGVTISYYIWSSSSEDNTLITFTVSNNFSCSADGGGNITSSDVVLIPTEVNDNTVGNYIKREVKVYPQTVTGATIYMDLWLTVNSISSALTNTNNFKYAFTTGSTSPTDGVVTSGNFRYKTATTKISLFSNKEYSSSLTDTYYLWIWLSAEETDSATMNQSFSLSLGGTCGDIKSYETVNLTENINIDIPNGLIPVVLSSDGTVTRSNTNSSWANYDNKIWANAVLVKENGTNTRDYYQNNIGVVIPEDDILAYFVYAPRYKYKIWTTELSSTGSEQEIEIIFETKDTTKSTGTIVGDYHTHSAFTLGTEELNGIWVGKFETTGSATAPTIKPSVLSLRNQTISAEFTTSKVFETSTYGLSINNDTHMAKNSEWGAVAYLSHSKYGRCTDGVCEEIRRNNNSGYYTGYSAVNIATSSLGSNSTSIISSAENEFGTSSDVTLPYNTEVGYLASTTGNISGVYDMSGGAWERVMGILSDDNGTPRSGNSSTYNSGFNGLLGNESMISNGVNFPNNKYYNLYISTNMLNACNSGICYGDALSEVNEWYNSTSSFCTASNPWIDRGGIYFNGSKADIFYFGNNSGTANIRSTFRVVLTNYTIKSN